MRGGHGGENPDFDSLTEEAVRRFLRADGYRLTVLESVDSTNSAVLELAEKGEAEGAVVIAARQTAGRGSKGRRFYSPGGTGVYMSLLLRPSLSADNLSLITPAAAVAVARALERVSGKRADIKWVNDVLIGRRKVCGILTEGRFREDGAWTAALGIGINVFPPQGGFPAEAGSAGAVFESARPCARSRVAAAVLDEWRGIYLSLPSLAFVEEYRARSAVVGRKITVRLPEGEFPATAVGIDDRCSLQVRLPGGEIRTLRAGDVSIVL